MNFVRVIRSILIALVLSTTITAAPPGRAQDIGTGWVTITSMGCNMAGASGTAGSACWINISGPTVGPSGCAGNSIRWDPTTSYNGQVALVQLTAAFTSGALVDIAMNDSCWTEWSSFPTI